MGEKRSFGDVVADGARTVIGYLFVAGFIALVLWMTGAFDSMARTYRSLTSPPAQHQPQPAREYVEQPVDVPEPPAATWWSCGWAPTMNEDWHDDILCERGSERVRPQLLTGQGYVTRAEMEAAGADYEAQLNR